jgi:chromosomal replication initiator protein
MAVKKKSQKYKIIIRSVLILFLVSAIIVTFYGPLEFFNFKKIPAEEIRKALQSVGINDLTILKKKIEREPVHVADDVIFFIAGLIKTNIRDLEGALIRVMAYSLMEEKPITLDLAKEALRDLLKETRRLITIDFIQRCVAEEFGISLSDLKTRRRNKNIVLPRQIAMYLSRELTDLSLPEIGNHFGGKDHTTVLHSFNKIKEDLNKNSVLKERVERIRQIIKQ